MFRFLLGRFEFVHLGPPQIVILSFVVTIHVVVLHTITVVIAHAPVPNSPAVKNDGAFVLEAPWLHGVERALAVGVKTIGGRRFGICRRLGICNLRLESNEFRSLLFEFRSLLVYFRGKEVHLLVLADRANLFVFSI